MVWRPAIVPTVGVRFLPGFGPKPDERDRAVLEAIARVDALHAALSKIDK